MRFAWLGPLLPMVIALSVVGCQQPAQTVVLAPVAAPTAPPPAPRRPVAATWSFHADDVCTANAENPAVSLEILASSSKFVLTARVARGIAMPAAHAVPIMFTGSTGTWSVMAQIAPSRRIVASQDMTEDNAGQILILLQGGTITIGKRNDGPPILRVPNSGVAGRDWFECVRHQLFP